MKHRPKPAEVFDAAKQVEYHARILIDDSAQWEDDDFCRVPPEDIERLGDANDALNLALYGPDEPPPGTPPDDPANVAAARAEARREALHEAAAHCEKVAAYKHQQRARATPQDSEYLRGQVYALNAAAAGIRALLAGCPPPAGGAARTGAEGEDAS